MLFSLQKKIAVVTGGGSGIGKATAECFAMQGAIVCILDLNEAAADETVRTIEGNGGQAKSYACNVTNQSATVASIQKITQQFKSVDILVNSAGVASVSKLETTTEAEFEKIFQINVKGTYNAMYAVIPQMRKQQKGVILNLASVAASVGIPDRFTYSMTKGAVVSMTFSVARDYVKEGIRCNCVSPARVHTPFVDGFLKANYPGKEEEMFATLSKLQPVGRMAKPEEIAYLALYLCSDEASFVTGCDYPIDGGFIKLNG